MTRILRANLKKFLGAKYERLPKTLAAWALVYFSLRASGLRLAIAAPVLWLSALFLTVSGFAVLLASDDTVDSLRGQLMLPESPARFHAAFFLTLAVYTLLTKTGLLLIAYLALAVPTVPAVAGFALCFIMGGAAVYPLTFRAEKKTAIRRAAGGPDDKTGRPAYGFTVYLLRRLWNNKNYLFNTAALWVFGCVFARFMSNMGAPGIYPLGFALMCLNTPLGILLSGDRALYRQVLFLPGQTRGVLLPYALFVAAVNLAACAVFMISWYLAAGRISPAMPALALLVSALGAALTVWLERQFPLLGWQAESDLWRHPRKYIVPGVLIVFASLTIMLGQL